jgi:hypothetical protein
MGITFVGVRGRQVAGFQAAFTVLIPHMDEAPVDAQAYYGALAHVRNREFQEISDDGIDELEDMLSRASRL